MPVETEQSLLMVALLSLLCFTTSHETSPRRVTRYVGNGLWFAVVVFTVKQFKRDRA